ncbi:hypothetical protein APUTEX25_004308 [Auxenochlorella protothecoides]|uniref:Uncharacterized protein n=1 Tax=Auxenochlorella protothecoides TaxID=3075 RepID=A0A3M7L5U7_AUXPR|nr:hypothetical protein APUTEX25_004308 [Auxenochlorella protothecoides]|eukprot:RMZ57474.1 hypothetical protein APUTEX25_004308 [Auxenochlorella protothecoides]
MEGGRSSAAEKLIRGHIAAATTVGGLLLSEASPALAQDAGPAASVAAGAAPALPAIDPAQLSSGVDTAVGTLVDLLRAAGSGIKSGLGGAQDGLEAAESAYSRIAPYPPLSSSEARGTLFGSISGDAERGPGEQGQTAPLLAYPGVSNALLGLPQLGGLPPAPGPHGNNQPLPPSQ